MEKNASDELMDKLLNNEVSFAAAEKMLEMPEEEQNKLLKKQQEKRLKLRKSKRE